MYKKKTMYNKFGYVFSNGSVCVRTHRYSHLPLFYIGECVCACKPSDFQSFSIMAHRQGAKMVRVHHHFLDH